MAARSVGVSQDDLKRAAKDAIRTNLTGLIDAIASDLDGIVAACSEKGLISPSACSNILDESTNATKRRRATQLVDVISSLVGFQPKYLDTFLCVLDHDKGGTHGSGMAICIAREYGHKLPMFEKKRANTEKNIKPEHKVVPQPTLEISTEENDGSEEIPQPPDVDCPEINPVPTPFTEGLVTDVNVILVTATEVEFCAVMGQVNDAFQVLHNNVPTFYLGFYGLCKVAVIQTGQGSKKTREYLDKLQGVIKADYVIAIGICYGMKKDKVKPGDVIVAESIFDISIKRVEEDNKIILRLEQHKCGENLCSIFRESVRFNGSAAMGSVCIKFGPLVSEPTLVATQEYKDQILSQIPQALGGEMEGNGIMASAEAGGFEGIVIKAVADYGNKDKEPYRKWQKFAATAAARYVLFHLGQENICELQLQPKLKIPKTSEEREK